MKGYILCSLSLLLLVSCKKKADVAVTPSIQTTKSDSVIHIFTPHADTFIGTYYDSTFINYGYGEEYQYSFLDSSYIFYAIYPNVNQIVFISPGVIFNVNDTFIKNDNDYYLSGYNPSRNSPFQFTQIGVDTFRISGSINKTLYFNMAYCRYICVDGEDNFCSFTGVKK